MRREMVSLFALVSPVNDSTVWENWFRFCLEQEERHGFAFTHLGCKTASLHPNGIRTRSRYLKKTEAALEAGEKISSIGFYLLPKGFRQAVFDFKVYMGLSLREDEKSNCEITLENGFREGLSCQELLEELRGFLHIRKAEINLLPYNQTFNYNFNCILSPTPGSQDRDYGLIRRLYQEP